MLTNNSYYVFMLFIFYIASTCHCPNRVEQHHQAGDSTAFKDLYEVIYEIV